MSDLNLFSESTQKEQKEKKIIKVSKTWVIIIGVNFFVFLIALVITFVNIYYNVQLNDKGKKLIDLIATQRQYKTVMNSLEDVVAKKAAVATLSESKIYLEKIIAEVDKQTNLSISNYNIDVNSSNYNIKGKIKNLEDVYTITTQLRQSKLLVNVRLNSVQFQDNSNYLYSISFTLNTDEAKQLK